MPEQPQPAHEMSRELVNLLTRAQDSGEVATVAGMQDELGVGHDDLMEMLGQLRERGMASEIAPGEWAASDTAPVPPAAEREGEDGRVTVTVPDEAPGPDGEAEEGATWWQPAVEPNVRLTRAIANALDDEALGKLVKAGLNDTEEAEGFLLEVTP